MWSILQEGHEALVTPWIQSSLQTALGSPTSEPKDALVIRLKNQVTLGQRLGLSSAAPSLRGGQGCEPRGQPGGDAPGRTGLLCLFVRSPTLSLETEQTQPARFIQLSRAKGIFSG